MNLTFQRCSSTYNTCHIILCFLEFFTLSLEACLFVAQKKEILRIQRATLVAAFLAAVARNILAS